MKYDLDASDRLKNLMLLAKPMSVVDIQTAIETFELNDRQVPSYADSTEYDIRYKDSYYPPKVIFGLALSSILGEELKSKHFSGGLGSECFKVLTRLGYKIFTKSGVPIEDLEASISTEAVPPLESTTSTKRPIIIGHIEGIHEGSSFSSRKDMMSSSFHRVWTSGIDGNGKEGTAAIVLSGGYVDDSDYGDEIVYTGAGGNKNGKQVSDQTWIQPGNAGLLKSRDTGQPVRVIRGYKHKSEFSPKTGYLYAGLYSVVDAWEQKNKDGFIICRFRLVYSGNNQERKPIEQIELDYSKNSTERREGTVIRIVRDTKKSGQIKDTYDYKCQICKLAIKTKNGFYAEGAHIKPLGRPHNGDDSVDNLLCLCPNHHVMFDKGIFSIADDLTLLGNVEGKLVVKDGHYINPENFKYHRNTHGYN